MGFSDDVLSWFWRRFVLGDCSVQIKPCVRYKMNRSADIQSPCGTPYVAQQTVNINILCDALSTQCSYRWFVLMSHDYIAVSRQYIMREMWKQEMWTQKMWSVQLRKCECGKCECRKCECRKCECRKCEVYHEGKINAGNVKLCYHEGNVKHTIRDMWMQEMWSIRWRKCECRKCEAYDEGNVNAGNVRNTMRGIWHTWTFYLKHMLPN